MIEQLSTKTYLKLIYANNCFGKANLISTKSSCGVTAEILISVYRIWHRMRVWTEQAADPGNLPGCLLYCAWNRMANVYASYPARPSTPGRARVSLMKNLTAWLLWRARLSWGKWCGTVSPTHWQLTHCARLAHFVFLHREMNVLWRRDERICVLNTWMLHVTEAWTLQKTATTHEHGKGSSLNLASDFISIKTMGENAIQINIWVHQC